MVMGTSNTSKTAAAKKATASAPETPEANAEQREAAATVTKGERRAIDRVAAVSYRADGTPDQTEGYEVLGDDKD